MVRIENAKSCTTFFRLVLCREGLTVAMLGWWLSACAQPTATIDRSSLSTEARAQDAFALPPPGGPAVVGAIERRFANAIQQDIILSTSSVTPGQNTLRIQLLGPVVSDGGETTLSDLQPTESSVAREMRRALPGVAMVRSPLFAQNSYGPFGYATGKVGTNDLCLYAWQRITAMHSEATFRTSGAIQVRLRLCQTGATEEGLLAVMYGYTINASMTGNWKPYGLLQGADPRLGTTGQPIHPHGLSGSSMIMTSAPNEPSTARSTPRPTVSATPISQEPPSLPAVPANAPIVPPPPTTSSHKVEPVVPPPPSD